jgi:RNA polymerase sigma-70 factor (ECF subfamily)
MTTPPPTRPSLLVRLRDAADADAWRKFVDLYAPLVYGLARHRGLQDADAADLTQEVLRAVAAAAERLEYDPRRGSFRGWLFTVARNRLADFFTARGRAAVASGGSEARELLENQPAPDDETERWDREYERRLFAWAAERVRVDFTEKTWAAFWQAAVEGKPPAEVSAALGLSVGAIYIAKSRVQARLKEVLREATGDE